MPDGIGAGQRRNFGKFCNPDFFRRRCALLSVRGHPRFPQTLPRIDSMSDLPAVPQTLPDSGHATAARDESNSIGIWCVAGLLMAVWWLSGWVGRIPEPLQSVVEPRAARYAAVAPELRRLWSAMTSRLETAQPVAHAKWSTNTPILDAPREEAKLRSLAEQGAEIGLSEHLVASTFRPLIEAHKQRQAEWMAGWKQAGQAPAGPAPDLVQQIRPQLDRIDAELLAILRTCSLRTPADVDWPDWIWLCETEGAHSEAVRESLKAAGAALLNRPFPMRDTK